MSIKNKDSAINKIIQILDEYQSVFLYVAIMWLFFCISTIYYTKVFVVPNQNDTLTQMGQLGDSFNILTSLFTGLAFAGVVITILLQKTELKETREEFKRQAEALEMQQLDNKFFQMLNELNNLVTRLRYNVQIMGLDSFIQLSNIADITFKEKEEFPLKFKEFNNLYDTTFKYYFINLYQVINYIDTNIYVEEKDKEVKNIEEDIKKLKKEYINIVRAQQTKNQLKLLFFNGIGVIPFSKDKYKILIERYALFEHIRYSDLLSIQEEGKIYKDQEELQTEYETIYGWNMATKINAEAFGEHFTLKNHVLIDWLLIQYEEGAFGENEDLKKIWKNRKELLSGNSDAIQSETI